MPRDMLAETELLIESGAPVIESTPLTPAEQFEQARTLHEVLHLGIADFEAILDDARYHIHLSNWHRPLGSSPQDKGQCVVCMAGSVMARSLGADVRHNLVPENFPDEVNARLTALDYLRMGNVRCAAIMMDLPHLCDAAVDLSEYWAPILRQFIESPMLDKVEGYWFLACMRALQADLVEARL